MRLLAHKAIALQSGQKHGLHYLPAPLMPTHMGKQRYALPAHKASFFCPLSPEASRLTVFVLPKISVQMKEQKRALARQGARPGVWPVRRKRSAWLDFLWLLSLIKQRK